MRGDFVHNQVMARPIEAALQLKGYPTFREYPVRPGQRPSAVDLATRINRWFVLFEFERTADRVGNDLTKAEQVGADLLNIVVPDATVRTRVRRALARLGHTGGGSPPRIQVMTLGAALQWVANNCPIVSARNVTCDMGTSETATQLDHAH